MFWRVCIRVRLLTRARIVVFVDYEITCIHDFVAASLFLFTFIMKHTANCVCKIKRILKRVILVPYVSTILNLEHRSRVTHFEPNEKELKRQHRKLDEKEEKRKENGSVSTVMYNVPKGEKEM